jgi:mannose-6-phosphate isomerase-like protein (cupin superfamily)
MGWRTGNAVDDGGARRGWLVGHFVDDDPVRRSADVEVKWALHPAGEERTEWVTGEQRTALVLLVSGRFRMWFAASEGDEREEVVLVRQGDYVLWTPGTDHVWHAEQDTVVVTIRWPSVASGS